MLMSDSKMQQKNPNFKTYFCFKWAIQQNVSKLNLNLNFPISMAKLSFQIFKTSFVEK